MLIKNQILCIMVITFECSRYMPLLHHRFSALLIQDLPKIYHMVPACVISNSLLSKTISLYETLHFLSSKQCGIVLLSACATAIHNGVIAAWELGGIIFIGLIAL